MNTITGMEIISEKTATEMDHLTESEKNQWKSFLNYNYWEGNYNPDNFFDFNQVDDMFYEGSMDDISVDIWEITLNNGSKLRLIDMYGWPGDNQAGAIFLDSDPQILMTNSDTCLSPYDGYNNPYSDINDMLLDFNFASIREKRWISE